MRKLKYSLRNKNMINTKMYSLILCSEHSKVVCNHNCVILILGTSSKYKNIIV